MARVMQIALMAMLAVAMVGCARKGHMNGANGGSTSLNGGDDFVTGGDTIGNPGAYGEKFEETRTRINDSGLETLYFAFDSSLIPTEEQAKADAAAQYLFDNPSYVMIIEGHCDERGSNEYNVSLSEQRAIGVKDYMVARGVDANRIQTRAFGEEQPAVQGATEEAYRMNRRGEFVPYK